MRPNVGCLPSAVENLESLSHLTEILNVEKMYKCLGCSGNELEAPGLSFLAPHGTSLPPMAFPDPSHIISALLFLILTSLVAQTIKASAYNAGDMGSIPGLGRSPAKEMATHSSILAWKIPWTEEPAVHGITESDMTERLHFSLIPCQPISRPAG